MTVAQTLSVVAALAAPSGLAIVFATLRLGRSRPRAGAALEGAMAHLIALELGVRDV